jgi:hypothetical protein
MLPAKLAIEREIPAGVPDGLEITTQNGQAYIVEPGSGVGSPKILLDPTVALRRGLLVNLEDGSATGPDLLQVVIDIVNHGHCPNCGCDLWNTKGCPTCPVMRRAYDALVIRGLKPSRQYAEYMEPDEINKQNMAGKVAS